MWQERSKNVLTMPFLNEIGRFGDVPDFEIDPCMEICAGQSGI